MFTRKITVSIVLIINFLTLSGQDFDIILGRPTNTSVTVSILFSKNATVQIQYGTVSGKYEQTSPVINFQQNVPQEVDLNGLAANTKYFYVLSYKLSTSNSTVQSPEFSFQTQRIKGSTFSFTVESDEHLYDKKGIRSMYKITLQNQLLDKPDFMFSLGDTFGDDHLPFSITSQELDELHKDYRQYLGLICHSVPFYFGLGNHEGENDYYLTRNAPNNLAVWGTLWRKYYYPNPFPNQFYSGNTDQEPYGIGYPENYYAFTWGDALFVVLDPYRYQNPNSDKPQNWEWTLGLKQFNWLKTTLEGSTSKYKFVFAHHVRGQGRGGITNAKLYEWGGYESDGKTWGFDKNRPGWGKPIHQLFKDNGVSIFFQGHDHLFAHEILDGVHYQEVPMPSDSTYMIGKLANADAYVSDTLDGTGHIRVQVTNSCIKVDYIKAFLPKDTVSGKNKNRSVAFSYTIGTCTVTSIENIDREDLDKRINIYPNPSRTFLNFKPIKNEEFIVFLYDQNGSMVAKTSQQSMNISSLPPGMYIAQIKMSNETISKKIIIGN